MASRLIVLTGIATVGLALTASCSDDEDTSGAGAAGATGGTGGMGATGGTAGEGGDAGMGGEAGMGGGTGETCGEAIELTTSGIVAGTSMGLANDYTAAGCVSGMPADGPDLVYSVDVPDGFYLDVAVIPQGWDAAIGLMGECNGTSMPTCVVDSTLEGEIEGTFQDVNTSGSTQKVFIVVDGYDATSSGPFELALSVHDNSVGEDCAAPISIPKGEAMAAGGKTVAGGYGGFADDLFMDTNGCTGAFTGGFDIVYAVEGVNMGETVTATVTPFTIDDDVAVYLTDDPGCDDLSGCVGSDAGLAGEPDTASFSPAATATVYVVVDSYNNAASHGYLLNVEVQ
jgi:hypothetical protein